MAVPLSDLERVRTDFVDQVHCPCAICHASMSKGMSHSTANHAMRCFCNQTTILWIPPLTVELQVCLRVVMAIYIL